MCACSFDPGRMDQKDGTDESGLQVAELLRIQRRSAGKAYADSPFTAEVSRDLYLAAAF